jgi:hypothetical protein
VVYKVLVGKPETKKALQRPRRRWDDNIGIVLRRTGWKVMDWVHLSGGFFRK